MASSSTSYVCKSFRYDVFLSFRGEDTRTNFIDHLYYALKQKNIYTYKDDEAIEKGKLISDELIRSIEDSKFYIIVFSKNYASSSWCLDELVKIMECHKTNDHTAFPVFYDVEPTEVRNQIGAVGEAFTKHENDVAARKWKMALKEAAGLAGWELKNTANGHEAKFIQKIVEEISLQLRPVDFNFDEKLVGMKTRVNDVVLSLENGISDVRMIGIKGMGGGGKTTLARAIFDQISFQFEGKCFVENVREVSNSSLHGLKSLQNQVLSNVLNDQGISVDSVYDGKNMMKRRMCGKKVLLVLDDVDHIEQLEALIEPRWFKPGSTIIITTRDEQVLVAHRVKLIIDVNLLSYMEALCLFSRYAFGRDIPMQGYEELSKQVLDYAAGLPLTIKVLGSFLYGKNEREWIDALKRLETIPLNETIKKLEISYLSLEEDYKEIFLNVACILKGWSKDLAIEALESCGFYATNGLKVLEQKSLITMRNNFVGMHDHMEEMGREIVRRSHPDSRLWIDEEIKDILANDLGTRATRIRYIQFHIGNVDLEIVMKGLRKMKELRFLHMSRDIKRYIEGDRNYDNVSQHFPSALQYLHWYEYPWSSLPNTFQGNNLVALKMADSKITQLWDGGERKVLNKLKILKLNNSGLTTLDLGLIPNIEALSLKGSIGLVQLHMLDGCVKLRYVDLSFSKLKTIDLCSAVNLELLRLECCNALEELRLPYGCLKLKSIDLGNSKLKTIDLCSAVNLELLRLQYCNALEELRLPDGCLKLKSIDLSTSKLKTIDLLSAVNLELLRLEGCNAMLELRLPDGCLKLKSINLIHSKLKTIDLRSAVNLEVLGLYDCSALVELHMPTKCLNLGSLKLTKSTLKTLDIGSTPNLKDLDLNGCYDLEELHMADTCQKLASLNISHSMLETLDLGLTPNLKDLDLEGCKSLVQLHVPIGCLDNLDHLVLSGCLRFTSFVYKSREADPLAELHLIAKSLKRCPLHPDSTLRKFQFECFYKDAFLLTRNIEKLLSFGLCACTNFETFSGSICGLRLLRKLKIESYPEAPKDLDQVECLEELSFTMTSMKHLPDSICMLKHLISLDLSSCFLLEKLPEDIGRLECLKRLTLSSSKIKHLPDSICMLKHLIFLKLSNCFFIEKLPKDFGRLECLEVLYLSYTNIKHLPGSICMLKHLRELWLDDCSLLEKLPEDLDRLECLQVLNLRGCKLLLDIPINIREMKLLSLIDMQGKCIGHLPQNIGLLEVLRILGGF